MLLRLLTIVARPALLRFALAGMPVVHRVGWRRLFQGSAAAEKGGYCDGEESSGGFRYRHLS
jgi:hypothetical protein